jgi:MtN3 and saliva related transmembrane protein
MNLDSLTFLGFHAGAIISFGFIPQLLKGYRTEKLNDASYGMPVALATGMTLWLVYGVLRADLAVIPSLVYYVACFFY